MIRRVVCSVLALLLTPVCALAAAPTTVVNVSVVASSGNYAAGQTDTFGGCQMFPTNDIFNLDVYGVPVDSTSTTQINAASAALKTVSAQGGTDLLENPYESNYIDFVPYNAPTLTVSSSSSHTITGNPWPIANTSALPYRNGIVPYEPNYDQTTTFVQGPNGSGPCYLRLGGNLVPGGSPLGTSWSTYGDWYGSLSSMFSNGGAGESFSTSGIPLRAFNPRPDEFINGIIPHVVDIELPQAADCNPGVATQYPSNTGGGGQGTVNSEPCLAGAAHLRLKASFSETGYTGDALTMIYCLKHYGGIVADNGSNFNIYFSVKQNGHGGVPADSRDIDFGSDSGGLGHLWNNIHMTDFEVIKMGPTNGSAFTYPGIDTSTGTRQGY